MLFEKFTIIYNYVVLFSQGIIFYIFGLWVVKYLDDYSFLNYRLINAFSAVFALCLCVLKEGVFYIIRKTFKLELLDHMQYILIAFIGIVFSIILYTIDNNYYKNKYYLKLDSEFEKKT